MRRYKRTVTAAAALALALTAGACMGPGHTAEEPKGDRQPVILETAPVIAITTTPQEEEPAPEPVPGEELQARIYDIPLSQELQEYTFHRCEELGLTGPAIDYETVLAMMGQESDYTADAVSPTGDYGIMQINRINHDWLSEALNLKTPEGGEVSDAYLDPEQCIAAGTKMLADLAARYDDPHQVLMAYNMGEAGARKAWASGKTSSAYSEAVMARRAEILEKEKSDGT